MLTSPLSGVTVAVHLCYVKRRWTPVPVPHLYLYLYLKKNTERLGRACAKTGGL